GAVARGRAGPGAARERASGAAPMTTLARGEYHPFKGGEGDYIYLVPSAAVVKLDATTSAVLDALETEDAPARDLANRLATFFPLDDVRSAVEELLTVRAIKTVTPAPQQQILRAAQDDKVAGETKKKRSIPLSTLVLNV